jgi:hypothetical protein
MPLCSLSQEGTPVSPARTRNKCCFPNGERNVVCQLEQRPPAMRMVSVGNSGFFYATVENIRSGTTSF